MSFDALLVRTATIERYGSSEVDDFNDPVTGYTDPVTYPAWFDQISGDEIIVGRDVSIVRDRVFLPAGTPIGHLDRVTRDDGVVFEVWGEPARQFTPRGEHHVEALLRGISEA